MAGAAFEMMFECQFLMPTFRGRCHIWCDVAVPLFVAGAAFGDVGVSLFSGAAFGDVGVSLFVAGPAFGEIWVDSGSGQYPMQNALPKREKVRLANRRVYSLAISCSDHARIILGSSAISK